VPATARAHAVLVSTDPTAEARLDRSPGRVELRFSEPVETAFGALRVLDARGDEVSQGDLLRPAGDRIAVELPDSLPDGPYTVAWRIVSADSHPISGAYVFCVGENCDPAQAAVVADASASDAVGGAAAIVRFLGLALIVACIGGALALAYLLVGAPGELRRRVGRCATLAASLLALLAIPAIVLQGAEAGGIGLTDALSRDVVRDVLDTSFGEAIIARTVIALWLVTAFVVAARSRLAAGAALVLGAALAFTPGLGGHARVEGIAGLVADGMHVAAAGAWVGGLAATGLALALSTTGRGALARDLLPRFSAVAFVAVIVLVSAGIASSLMHVGEVSQLWDTTYGQLLLVKVGVLVPIVGLGAYNRRSTVPRARAGDGRGLGRPLGTELALMGLALVVTSALVAQPPADASASQARPFSTVSTLGPFELSVDVDPARPGRNFVHVLLYDPTSGLPGRVDTLIVKAELPAAGVGPLLLQVRGAGPGHFVLPAAALPLPGSWELRFEARRGEFDLFTQIITVPIRS
jgi:copper transport protein